MRLHRLLLAAGLVSPAACREPPGPDATHAAGAHAEREPTATEPAADRVRAPARREPTAAERAAADRALAPARRNAFEMQGTVPLPGAPPPLVERVRRLVPADLETRIVTFELMREMALSRLEPGRTTATLVWVSPAAGDEATAALERRLAADGWRAPGVASAPPLRDAEGDTLDWRVDAVPDRPTRVTVTVASTRPPGPLPSAHALLTELAGTGAEATPPVKSTLAPPSLAPAAAPPSLAPAAEPAAPAPPSLAFAAEPAPVRPSPAPVAKPAPVSPIPAPAPPRPMPEAAPPAWLDVAPAEAGYEVGHFHASTPGARSSDVVRLALAYRTPDAAAATALLDRLTERVRALGYQPDPRDPRLFAHADGSTFTGRIDGPAPGDLTVVHQRRWLRPR